MAVCRARGARAGRARSQHFLRSDRVASELVRAAGITGSDVVVDLGAGTGTLTSPLAAAARRVVAVELDPRCAGELRGRWNNVSVLEEDAAQVELPREPFRVVANLPFDRTTAILRHLLDDPRVPLTRAVVVVEWGVAMKRALPWPSSLNDVLWAAWYRFTLERRLPRAEFRPQPRVDAGVLVIERREQPLVDPKRCRAYRAFVASGFRHGLRGSRTPARELDAHQWAALFEARTTVPR